MKKWLLAGIIFLWGGFSFAYEFAPVGLERVRSLSSEEQVTDDNGEELSVLEVQTTIEGMIFDGAALPAQKTKDGYQVYVALGTDRLFLRAPGMKAFLWQMGELDPASAYWVRIERKGTAAQEDYAARLQAVNFRYEQLDPEGVRLRGENPSLYACVKINTDLPFSVLQEHFLQGGTYTGPVESAWYKENYNDWNGQVTPPYILLVKPGAKLEDVLEWSKIGGLVKGETTLDENKGVYWIELSSAGEEKVAPDVTRQVKAQLQRNLKP